MKRQLWKRRILALGLMLGLLLVLNGCSGQQKERQSEDLSRTDIVLEVQTPAEDA